jgi:hypothetical protein
MRKDIGEQFVRVKRIRLAAGGERVYCRGEGKSAKVDRGAEGLPKLDKQHRVKNKRMI